MLDDVSQGWFGSFPDQRMQICTPICESDGQWCRLWFSHEFQGIETLKHELPGEVVETPIPVGPKKLDEFWRENHRFPAKNHQLKKIPSDGIPLDTSDHLPGYQAMKKKPHSKNSTLKHTDRRIPSFSAWKSHDLERMQAVGLELQSLLEEGKVMTRPGGDGGVFQPFRAVNTPF